MRSTRPRKQTTGLGQQRSWVLLGELPYTHIVRRRDSDAVLLWMPRHVQDLLVKVNLVRIGFLAHPLRSSNRTARSGSLLTVLCASPSIVHWRWNTHLLRLERTLVSLEHNLCVFAFFRRVDHEIVVVRARHDILGIAREYNFELVEDAVVLVGVA